MVTATTLLVSILHLVLWRFSLGKYLFSPEMLNATTIEEFQMATTKHLNPTGQVDSMQRRRRDLQLLQIKDSQMILANQFKDVPAFYHGVASGDPLADSVIVWTRYTPRTKEETISLELRLAAVDSNLTLNDHLDPAKNVNLRRATIAITKASDFIAKIDMIGLSSNTKYVFAFSDGSVVSPIGQTRTAPGPADEVRTMRYAFFTCAHFTNGYFHAYDVASTIKDLDFWIHTGDYLYEYGTYGDYATDAKERIPLVQPQWEQISLQDYRNRMATYHTDTALQNLRRRAPMIAIWDDHETTNNAYGMGSAGTTGAENHQEVCRARPWSSKRMKKRLECDRNEGDIVQRLNNAFRSYLEWQPLRHQPGTMGVINLGSFIQVISWGDMATIVGVDTRTSHRSKGPTLRSSPLFDFIGVVLLHRDVRKYTKPGTLAYNWIQRIAKKIRSEQADSTLTMIGKQIDVLRTAFAKSKESGQPWQIWVASTPFASSVKGNFLNLGDYMTTRAKAAEINEESLKLHRSILGIIPRAVYATSTANLPWNLDDYSGFLHEKKAILQMFQQNASNPIVLGGDVHDGYGWQIFEEGKFNGTPAAVNLITPAVTSPGWSSTLISGYSKLAPTLGGTKPLFELIQKAEEGKNPGLKYVNFLNKGFVSVTVTKTKHVAEFISFTPETILTQYDPDPKVVAQYFCSVRLVTTAGQPGSLERSDTCSSTQFETNRPDLWSIPFPQVAIPPSLPLVTDCGYRQCTINMGI